MAGGGAVIAIIGAGFTGAMTALHLLRNGPDRARIFLVEKTPGFGGGLAYGLHNPSHLLNVRAGNMSAFPDEPDHLIRWLADRQRLGPAETDAFITRGVYGDYLSALIRQAIAGADGAERLLLVPDQAVGLDFDGDGGVLRLGMGRSLKIDAAVLALGNLPPLSPRHVGLELLARGQYAPDPWASDALDDLPPRDAVLILGSGLTMVDIALDLAERGHRGPLIALSRRGLTPHRHHPVGSVGPPPWDLAGRPLSEWVRERRSRAQGVGWRAAIDELRPMVQGLWRGATPTERRRFLRHLRPWWDVRRHRMAPAVADAFDVLRASGQLQVLAGRLMSVKPEDEGVDIVWRPRGEPQSRALSVSRIINCTGAGGDLSRTADPLLTGLIKQGAIRADPLGLGLEVDDACQALDHAGRPSRPLYAAGPIAQGYSWEVTAVPDIRNQVAALAATLTARLATQG